MNVRQRLEQEEAVRLSPFAAQSANSRGRARAADPCPLRTCFQRDRDRIIHCKSFRRLKHKTQCFLSPEGDHFRTRLTHTLEVAQVARTLARSLSLNEDLAEAIALGHDLGHTPFGHMGERTLNRLAEGGFSHREQSLRVVDVLEREGLGLNLTWEVRDGIVSHSDDTEPHTLEGWCVRRADRIAYINHDIDDALRAGVFRAADLPEDAACVLGGTHGERINAMIMDIAVESAGQPFVRMSPAVSHASDMLRRFLYDRVYESDWAMREERKVDQMITTLYQFYLHTPDALPEDFHPIREREGISRAACDYISCMTDGYAVRVFSNLFIPDAFR